MEKYEKDGEVAILVSPGFGAGWSTWNQASLAYDKKVVEYYLEHKDDDISEEELEKAFNEMGYDHVYFGGYDQIEIVWLPKGQQFRITEYDGSERIRFPEDYDWDIA